MPRVHSFSPRNTICFSEEDCMHQKVLIISISAVHCALTMECITLFQGMACTLKVPVKVTPQEMLQSLQGNVQRGRERERPPSSKNVATLCKIPLHTDSIFIGWFCLKLVFKANLLSVPSPCLFLVSNLQSFKAMQKPWDAKQIFYNPCPKMPQVIFDLKMHQFCYKSHHSQHSSRVGWKFHRNPAFLIIYLEAPNIIKHHSLQVVSKFPEFFATFCSFIPLPELLFAKNLTTMLSLCFLRKLLVSFPVFLDKNMSSTVRTWNFICPWRA